MPWPVKVLLGAALILGTLPNRGLGASPPEAPASDPSLDGLLRVLGSGDQPAMERYIAASYDPEALRTTSAAERADRMARLYVDTGGFTIDRRVQVAFDGEIARASATLTGLPSCLVLNVSRRGGRKAISDFEAADLPLAASPRLTNPAPAEVVKVLTPFLDRLARSDRMSGVVLVAKDGRPFLHSAYGYSDVDRKIPNQLGTRFNIASIGKSITAVVVAQLVEQGRLSLDDKVGKHLPAYPDREVRENVTIRHLLTHTSGLGEKSEFTSSPQWGKTTILTINDYVPLIVGHPLASEPGTKYSYSNAGFVILGRIVEAASGASFYDVVRERVFKRAGMRRSFYRDPTAASPMVATGLTNFVFEGSDYVYRLGKKSDASGESAAKGGSHGGAFMTARDLLRFMNAVRSAKLTRAPMAHLMMSPQGSGPAADTANGFGFEIASQNGHRIIGHRGGDIGVSAIAYHFEPSGYTAIVLSNYDPRAIRPISRKIRGLLTRKVIGDGAPLQESECDAAGRS